MFVLLLLASCTDSGNDGAPGQRLTETSDSNPAQNPDATAPADDLDGHQRGGKLIVLADTKPVTLDPTRASRPDELAILSLVTRSLTQYRYDPDTEQMVLVPDLATDLGRPNADFTKWTFTLRS
ncbi:MAG: ABC transporter substrate-binding protein, partial [Actinomycetota bacterium]|nr:ABC transporter substrate-binding protein [Actinomycetota bacterium]